MNLMPSFLAGGFAIAGLVLASAPLIIHLLNRRRYKVVEWAAMDFLQHAIRRNRRILHLRDLLLLLLRTAIVLLFGLALAQPFFSIGRSEFDGRQPLHAILLFDNSRSMDFVSLEGSLLDRAKAKAAQFIKRLPDGSMISVIPVCGSRHAISPDPYASKQHALDAIRRIEAVDRIASFAETLNVAEQAAKAAPLLSKRMVWLTDQQRGNFQRVDDERTLPDMQIVDVSDAARANTWIEDLKVQDGVADVNTPATLVVTVRHEGPERRQDVQVTLDVDGETVGSTTVSLEPGGAREIVFQHTFSAQQPTPQRPVTAAVTASLSPDRLPADDQRRLVVHVAASAPVVFIDQYGAENEDALQQRFGETRSLRRLLAPGAGSANATRQLVQVRHVRMSQVDRDLLADARLVVVAGVESPAGRADILRQYVEQGGQLLIAAGADFSPERWTDEAWLDGAGVLPMPLNVEPVGATPLEAKELTPFFVDFESLQNHSFFQLSGNSEDDVRDLFSEPFFFKAVETAWNDQNREKWIVSETKSQRAKLEIARDERAATKADPNSAANSDNEDHVSDSRWVAWASPARIALEDWGDSNLDRVARETALRSEPVVLASFDNKVPMLVQRFVGDGRVVLYTSGLVSPWSTLPKTNCFIVFDRILRDMLRDTFPTRNFLVQRRVDVALPIVDQEVNVGLQRPGGSLGGGAQGADSPDAALEEILHSGFLDERKTTFPALQGGLYRLEAMPIEPPDDGSKAEALWEIAVAIQPDSRESELAELNAVDFAALLPGDSIRVIGVDEQISMAGSQVHGQDTWWWLALAVFTLLLTELGILALPRFSARTSLANSAGTSQPGSSTEVQAA